MIFNGHLGAFLNSKGNMLNKDEVIYRVIIKLVIFSTE